MDDQTDYEKKIRNYKADLEKNTETAVLSNQSTKRKWSAGVSEETIDNLK